MKTALTVIILSFLSINVLGQVEIDTVSVSIFLPKKKKGYDYDYRTKFPDVRCRKRKNITKMAKDNNFTIIDIRLDN